MPIAAQNPTERAEQLLILTERLTGLMEREVELLNQRRPEYIREFEEERASLSTIYSQEMRLIKQDPSLIEGINRDLRDSLKSATHKFQGALAAHDMVIGRLRTMSERFIKAVSDEVSKKRAPTLGYGKNATFNVARSGAALPLAINQTA